MLFGKKILWEECADVGIPSTISLALTWYHSLAFNWRAGPSALDAWENRKLEPVVALQAPVGFWVDRPQSGKWNTAVGGIWQGKGSLARLGQYSLSDSEQVTSCDAPHTLLIQEMAWQWWAIISDLPRDKLMCIWGKSWQCHLQTASHIYTSCFMWYMMRLFIWLSLWE